MRLKKLLGPWGAIAAIAVCAVAAALVLLAAGTFTSSSAREGLTAMCPRGTSPVDDPAQHSGRNCAPLGQPETFQDLTTANTQIESRDTAPFSTVSPGAYMSAYRHRQAMAAPKASDENYAWALAGKPPLCADPTTNPSICPAASAANGNYSYMSALGFRTLTGRISALAYDPTSQGHYFASPVVGGVWESVDGATTWKSIGDNLPTQTVGALAYDAPLHRVIAGTGDNSFGGSGIAGHGIYYSDDDGATWKPAGGIPDLALSFKLVISPVDSSGNTIYAATSKGLYRSNDGGATFTNEALPTSPKGYSPNCAGDTTNRLCFFANDVTDVIVKPTKTSNAPAGAVIAAVGWRAGQVVDTDANGNPVKGCVNPGDSSGNNSCWQAPQNGLYESDTGQPGTFAYITPSGSPPQGLPATPIFGRTALAVAHGAGQSSDAVYALVQDALKFQGCPDVLDQQPPVCNKTITGEGVATVLNGLYASYDFGKTWTKVMDSTQLKQPGTNSALLGQPGYGPGVQAWYNLWVEADPTATDASTGYPTRVVFGLEEVWENNQILPTTGSGGVLTTPYTVYPGGTSANDPWVVIGRYWNGACGAVNAPEPCNNNVLKNSPIAGTTTHPDQHAYAMIPDGQGGETLVVGSDGGVYKQHIAKGADFNNDNWGDGQNATLSALQPYDATMAKDGTIVSGLQDNGEMKIAPNGHEAEIYGGDGFFSTIDPDHSTNIIEEYTYATVNLSRDGGSTWYPITPSNCSSSNSLFSTPIEEDPTMPGHILVGCTQIQEATNAYADPCANPDGGNANNCQATNSPFNTVYDLSTLPAPSGATNVPSAMAVQGANEYVGYCGYCDPATQKVPFANGIATNVGGSAPPKIGTGNGWHQAQALCSDCQTANGKLPNRYINSIQEDPSDPNTIYVTMGGYERRWIPPGSFGEDISNVGVGHLFVSHDHGDHFTNITGNLPDISANYTAMHDGQLLVGTDLGVYVETSPASGSAPPTFASLGTGLPMAPVFTIRQDPGNPDVFLVSTYGRGDWLYNFGSPAAVPVPKGVGTITLGGSKCTKPSGRLSRKHLGPLALGETKAKTRKSLRLLKVTVYGFDQFCLQGGPGIRAGYPSRKLLASLSARLRRSVSGKSVMLLTANHFYALDGVRPGSRVAFVSRTLHIKAKRFFAVGLNDWYVVPGRAADGILKVRHGVIEEIGIADKRLLTSHKADFRFFTSFRSG